MIALLTGVVALTGDGHAVIDVRGVGYLVQCSARTLAGLRPGAAARLQIETQVREDAITLFGFETALERDWFRLLQTVQGVGARVALAILSTLTPDRLARALVAQDKAALAAADGVGPKLAARLASELKDKAPALALSAAARQAPAATDAVEPEDVAEEDAPPPPPPAATKRKTTAKAPPPPAKPDPVPDCVSALENLGYRREEAFSAALRVQERLGRDADLPTLIRETLKELAPA